VKKLIFSIALFMVMTALRAQPQAFTYQTIVRDPGGEAISGQAVAFRISILQDSIDGLAVYREDHLTTTNGFGLAVLHIGNGDPVDGSFQAINWALTDHFLEVKLDISGGNNFAFMGVTQMMSVPYALHAQTVENISGNLLPPVAMGLEASWVTQVGASLNGFINPEGFSTLAVFEWGLSTAYGNTVEASQNPVTGSAELAVDAELSGLQPGTLYHYRIKATNAVGVSLSEDATFTTLTSPPQIITLPIADIGATSATLVGNVVYDGGALIISRGFYWGLAPDPQSTGVQIEAGSGEGEFTAGLTGLSENTVYYFMAYAVNSEGITYGTVLEFTTDPFVEVTFRVDLSEAVTYGALISFDTAVNTVNITGSMMNWAEPGSQPEQQQLSRISDIPLVYSITIHLDAGEYTYKFFTDALGVGWAGGEWGGDPNRMVALEADTLIEDAWGIYCAMPVAPLTGTNAPLLCEGDDIWLTVDSGTSWYWTGPNGFTSFDQNPVIINSTSNMGGLYSVFVTANQNPASSN